MSAPSSLPSTRILQLYATNDYACSYLPGRIARSQVVLPLEAIDTSAYAQLLEKGFRRSSQHIYRPWCDQCSACSPLRVPVDLFQPNRSQRRAWQRHANLSMRLLPLQFMPEHYQLYRAYQQARHPGGGMDTAEEQEYRDFILHSPVSSLLAEFRHEDTLKIVALIDVLPNALSAVYTFYANDAHAAYGTYAVLWQIAHARQTGKQWVYLGYWVPGSQKMHYKTRFQPCQVLQQGVWQNHTTRAAQ